MFLKLTDEISVSPQLDVADIARAKANGFSLIINNRPDGEAPDQPPGDSIAAAAEAAGLAYAHIPMANGGLTPDTIGKVRIALDGANGRTLMFCRSGTRSTMLWGLAEATAGKDPDILAETAKMAGYDLSPVLNVMMLIYEARTKSP